VGNGVIGLGKVGQDCRDFFLLPEYSFYEYCGMKGLECCGAVFPEAELGWEDDGI